MYLKVFALGIFVNILSVYGTLVQRKVTLSIPSDFPLGAPLYHVTAIDDVTGKRTESSRFVISRITSSPRMDKDNGQDDGSSSSSSYPMFVLDTRSAALLISPHKEIALNDYKGYSFFLEITDSGKDSGRSSIMNVVIRVSNETTMTSQSEEFCKPKKELCFAYPEGRLLIPESTEIGSVIAGLKPPSFAHLCPGLKYSYRTVGKGPLAVDDSSGYLELIEKLDHETKLNYSFNVSCQISREIHTSSINAIFTKSILVVVKDVNDNPPHIQNGTNPDSIIDSFDVIPGKPLPVQYTVLDPDSRSVNNISITLDDPLGLFYKRKPSYFYELFGHMMLVNVAVIPKAPLSFPGKSYSFSVIFDDTSLITKNDSKVVFYTTIVNKSIANEDLADLPSELWVNISRYATLHSRVLQPLDVRLEEGFAFRLSFQGSGGTEEGEETFNVTPKTGIVYVQNPSAIRRYIHRQFSFTFMWRKEGRLPEKSCVIVVAVEDSSGNTEKNCDVASTAASWTCATYDYEETCQANCGRGSSRGPCQWRKHNQPYESRQTSQYATCSPNLATCPDGHCDELEEIDRFICPQDCATTVNGEGVMNYRGKGIWMAASPCTCDDRSTCICMKRPSPAELKQEHDRWRMEARERKRRKQQQLDTAGAPQQQQTTTEVPSGFAGMKDVSSKSQRSICDERCIGMIASVTAVVVGLVAAATAVVIRHIGFGRGNKHKYVAGRMPLAAVGSDYVDDRTQQQQQLPPTTLESTLEDAPVDTKWEFPRDKLILQELLGEGEFGKVVKAQAWNIANRPGYSTVAVKTLKDNGTSSEEQDLLSELNLLRDVSHPNVIQLLGACTSKGGPLCIIVEYAELGSLSTYLKKLRSRIVPVSVNNPSYFTDVGASASSENQAHKEINQEILSFAWQTAKGMSYLSDMKLVHRDLAARNILLAKNKIVKISDFGLSRDVYEGDTYLKTTKGRVPVKWMAIESLEDHIYTIKSDVWSFGVVLWEIITLGASPYPGITPERLYHLLKGGYRMPKPDTCSPELYKIMKKCWRDAPHERPSFKELVGYLDRLLQDTVDYLPLGPAELMNQVDDSTSRSNTGASSQVNDRHNSLPTVTFASSSISEPRDPDVASSCSNIHHHNNKNTNNNNNNIKVGQRKLSSLHFLTTTTSDGNEYENRRLLPPDDNNVNGDASSSSG